jgi:hypothetical protein
MGRSRALRAAAAGSVVALLQGCAAPALVPYSTEGVPLALVPAPLAGIRDARGAFRSRFCQAAGVADSAADCERLLPRLAGEGSAAPSADPADTRLRRVLFVPGLWSDCVRTLTGTERLLREAFAAAGWRFAVVKVDGTSSSEGNAGRLHEAVLEGTGAPGDTVLIGHSKGVVDILVALDTHPEMRARVAAVVSMAGAVGGSPLAPRAPRALITAVRNTPGLTCQKGDGRALESLDPQIRRDWLARHALPEGIRFYSLVAYPAPERISRGLSTSHGLLSRIDARNDGLLLAFDQVIPGSTLLGYVNADHWAIATQVPGALHGIPRHIANRNDFPRGPLLQAILAQVVADADAADVSGGPRQAASPQPH